MSVTFYPGEAIHPSMLPENRDRTALFQVFNQFKAEAGAYFGPSSYQDPPQGYERAWRTFLGANINGQMYFVCHISEGFNTAKAYNCEDSTTPKCPVLLYGEPFHIRSETMNAFRHNFPDHHKGKVPYQAAFAGIVGTSSQNFPIPTHSFALSPLVPGGAQSLSFKTASFPIEFWTHTSRAPVIFTALDLERQKPQPNAALITIYDQACQLETAFTAEENTFRDLERQLAAKQDEILQKTVSLNRILSNPNIPAARKNQLVTQKRQEIAATDMERATLALHVAQAQQRVLQASQTIDQYKAAHFADLPHSYREATFQIAFDTTLPDGSVVYKQYNGETGKFELSQHPDREVRFLNDVHMPYFPIVV